MEPHVITDSRIIERYMLGQLPEAEARYLEQMLQRHPALLDRLDLPSASERLDHLLELTGARPSRPREGSRWCHLGLVASLSVALIAALGLAIGSSRVRHQLSTELTEAHHALRDGSLTAPDHVSHVRIVPTSPQKPISLVDLGNRTAPAFAEMHIDASALASADFGLSVRRDDHTYWARIDHLHRDSNGEIRIAINVAALPAGRYLWQLDTLDATGAHHPAAQFLADVTSQ
jgi:hypothetical protein